MLLCTSVPPVQAADPPTPEQTLPATPQQREQEPLKSNQAKPTEPEGTGIFERSKLLGDAGGLRTMLEARGITLGLQEQSEVLANATGGIRQGAIFEGATLASLGVDLDKLLGLPGGALNISAYQIHGRGLSANNVRNLNVVSGIEAPRSTRLFELWYEQALLDGKVTLRLGQQAADQEFITTQYGALFLNAGFGWPTLPAVDLPSGGPAYPLATPAVRLKVLPTDDITVLGGIINGDPADNGSGTSFEFNRGVFAIAELQYAINKGDNATGLPGIYKFGGFYNSQRFLDQRFGTDGLSLADPATNGMAVQRHNNYSIYATADQLVYRTPGTKDGGVGVFARILGAPGDRNPVNLFVNGGVTYKGIVPGRENDTAGVAFGLARISDTARDFDFDTARFSGSFTPIRRSETVLELTYQAQVTPWLSLQPDFQYIFNPGGSVTDPNHPSRPIGDAAIFGLRSTIVF